MPQQETPQETVHSGKQVLLRLGGFILAIIVIVVIWKLLVG